MALGWFADLTEAKAFMSAQPDTSSFSALTDEQQTAYYKAAYDRLRFCGLFTIPSSPSSDDLEKLQISQGVQAFYLHKHKADEDLRLGLQAQGVTEAEIVSEKYDSAKTTGIHPFIFGVLQTMKKARYCIKSYQMTRNNELN